MKSDPFIDRHRMTPDNWAALKAQGFTDTIRKPPVKKTGCIGPNLHLQAAFDEYMAMVNPPRGTIPELSRKHGCSHSSLLNKIYKYRLNEKGRAA